jgi:hypothetical protein
MSIRNARIALSMLKNIAFNFRHVEDSGPYAFATVWTSLRQK